MVDATGAVVETYTYGVYGELLSGDTTLTRFLYNGRCGVSTDDNGLYYMRQRYYNPEIKRFVNQDILTGSIGNSQSLNRYSYVQGNPVSYTDPFGLSPLNGLFSGTMLTHTVCELLGWIPGPVGGIANFIDGIVYAVVDKDYKNAFYSLGSSVSFFAGKLVACAGKGSKTALRIRRVCNFAGSAINFAQSAEGTVNMGGMMIDKYIIQGQPFDDSTAMEFLFLGASMFGATKSGVAIATDVRDFGKFAKGSWAKGISSSKVNWTRKGSKIDVRNGKEPFVKMNLQFFAGDGKSKTYQTYTKKNPITGKVYSGRTSGTGTPAENIRKRDANHHMSAKGFEPAVLDKSSSNYFAIRGREQMLIDYHGGAQSMGGTSGNAINGIGINNKKKSIYFNAAKGVFGDIE